MQSIKIREGTGSAEGIAKGRSVWFVGELEPDPSVTLYLSQYFVKC